jgi:perosamine synthetase
MIPVSSPTFLGNERQYVLDCIDRTELSMGSYVRRFEEAFADFCGVNHAMTCANGTVALHLAMLAHDVRPGDRVLMPALTYVATANAVTYCGGVPVFCDVDPDTWCISPIDVERTLRQLAKHRIRPVGIVPVHLYGAMADMCQLKSIAEEYGMWIVEDAAEAHGAVYKGVRAGGQGNLATFSFYGNKIITTGEGGMVVTNDHHLDAVMRTYRGQGMDPNRRYWHDVVGYNYRMANVPAAIGLAQLERFEQHAAMREEVAEAYRFYMPYEFKFQEVLPNTRSSNWMVTVLVPKGVNRDEVMRRMANDGVETRPVFVPMTDLPPYRSVTPPVSRDVASRGINLPTYASLLSADVQRVVQTLVKALS